MEETMTNEGRILDRAARWTVYTPDPAAPTGWASGSVRGAPEPRAGDLVVDRSDVLARRPRLAVIAPMLGPEFHPTDISRASRPMAEMLAVGAEGEFRELAQLASETPEGQDGPLDKVGRDRWARWWHARGARVGIVQASGSIAWMDPARPLEIGRWRASDRSREIISAVATAARRPEKGDSVRLAAISRILIVPYGRSAARIVATNGKVIATGIIPDRPHDAILALPIDATMALATGAARELDIIVERLPSGETVASTRIRLETGELIETDASANDAAAAGRWPDWTATYRWLRDGSPHRKGSRPRLDDGQRALAVAAARTGMDQTDRLEMILAPRGAGPMWMAGPRVAVAIMPLADPRTGRALRGASVETTDAEAAERLAWILHRIDPEAYPHPHA